MSVFRPPDLRLRDPLTMTRAMLSEDDDTSERRASQAGNAGCYSAEAPASPLRGSEPSTLVNTQLDSPTRGRRPVTLTYAALNTPTRGSRPSPVYSSDLNTPVLSHNPSFPGTPVLMSPQDFSALMGYDDLPLQSTVQQWTQSSDIPVQASSEATTPPMSGLLNMIPTVVYQHSPVNSALPSATAAASCETSHDMPFTIPITLTPPPQLYQTLSSVSTSAAYEPQLGSGYQQQPTVTSYDASIQYSRSSCSSSSMSSDVFTPHSASNDVITPHSASSDVITPHSASTDLFTTHGVSNEVFTTSSVSNDVFTAPSTSTDVFSQPTAANEVTFPETVLKRSFSAVDDTEDDIAEADPELLLGPALNQALRPAITSLVKQGLKDTIQTKRLRQDGKELVVEHREPQPEQVS